MTEREMRQRRWLRAAAPITGVVLLLAGCGPDNGQNSLRTEGRSANKIAALFRWPFWVAVVIGVLVLAGTLFAALKFRERPGNENPKQVHGNTTLEIGWTIVPALILIVLAVPTVATVFDLAKDPKGDVLDIRVVGKQWWWQFEYPDQQVVTANEFHIPAGRNVRLELTACDKTLGSGPARCNVVHSFWIPELAGKQDVIPGRKQKLVLKADTDQVGKYFLGQCAEFCGLSHARMQMRVYVDTPEDFDNWVQAQQQTPDPVLDADGQPTGDTQKLLSTTYGCTSCHSIDDSSTASYGPNLAHLGGRKTFASGSYELERKNLKKWVMDAPSMVPMQVKNCPAGQKPGCVGMPSFTENLVAGQQKMTSEDADAIVSYLLAQK